MGFDSISQRPIGSADAGNLDVVRDILERMRDSSAAKAEARRVELGDLDALTLAAARRGDLGALEIAIERAPWQGLRDDDGCGLLALAAGSGSLECVRLLLAKGAELRSQNFDGLDPAMAAAQGGHPLVLEALFAAGSSADVRDGMGQTLVMRALDAKLGWMDSIEDCSDCLRLAIARGCPIDAVDDAGWTAAMWAVEGGNTSALALLVELGCDLSVMGSPLKKGRPDRVSALDLAEEDSREGGCASIVRAALERGELRRQLPVGSSGESPRRL